MTTTEGKKQPTLRSAHALPNTAKKHKAKGLPEEPPKKRKTRGPTRHFKLKKRVLPLRQGVCWREQVKEEFSHLLKCEESLVVNRAIGVNAQRAQVNQTWEERYLDFLVFSKEYGHTHVPKMYVENPALGRWVVKMRAWKRKNDKNLTSSRLQRLEAAGFIWNPKADPDFYKIQGDNEKAGDVWDENYADLLEYKEEHGDCMVPKSFARNQRLARWVTKQRSHYKAKQSNRYHTLTDDKEKRLVDIGFVFNTRTTEFLRQSALKHYEDRWDGYIEKLIAFKEEHGHCAVPRRWKSDTQLASWVMRQRMQWRSKQQGEHSYLTNERIEQLKAIGFVFGMIDRKIFPVEGMKPRVIRTNDTAKWKTYRTKTEEASDQEEPHSDEDLDVENDEDSELISSEDGGDDDETESSDSDENLDVENDEDSELISSEDGGNDGETESDDSEDEGIRSEEDGNPTEIASDFNGDAEALKNLAIAAVM